MEFQSVIDEHRSQLKFYQLSCLALIGIVALLAIVVPSSLKTGPYIVLEQNGFQSVAASQPWKLTTSRIEGFLKLYLSARFEWSKDSISSQKALLKELLTDQTFSKMKESIFGLEAVVKNQGAQSFYILEGYRYANKERILEAQVSRVIRVSNTGVITPLLIRLQFDETSISESNPYGLRVTSIEEQERSQGKSE